ncbi:hypothetical protein CP08DC60_1234A, partial [Chlamydia psittaci 08DC60]|jgi:hypothetical protein
MPNQ